MTRMPLRHIVIASFLLAATGCATNLGDRVDALEQRVGELEQNSQTQRVVMDARFDAIKLELSANKPQPAKSPPAKGGKLSAPDYAPDYAHGAAAPRYIDPGPSLAKVAANAAASGNAGNPAPQPHGQAHDPVREALASAKGQPPEKFSEKFPEDSPAYSPAYSPEESPQKPSGEPSPPGDSRPATQYAAQGESRGKLQGGIPAQPVPGERFGGYAGNAAVTADYPGQRSGSQAVSAKTPQAKAPAKSGPEAAYKSALNLLESGKPAAAKQAFEKFIAEYPDSNLMPNAYYWLGESNYTLKRYDQAILIFKDVPNKYPRHPKAPAAMLKTAFAYLQLGDDENARFYLRTLLEQYPDSEPSGLARKRLSSL